MEYLTLKWLHIVSATLLYGTGLGSAFYKLMADKSGDLRAIDHVNGKVVLADWLFTTPTVIVQPLTGVILARMAGYPLTSSWLVTAIALYVLAGLCWLPVVWLQIRMKALSAQAVNAGVDLDGRYRRLARAWFWLGIPAFSALLAIYALMVFKPTLWS